MPETSFFRTSFRMLLPSAVLLLALAVPAHGQWYEESTIDISGLNYNLDGMSGSLTTGMELAIAGDTAVVGGGRDAYIFERNSAGQWNRTTTFTVVPNSIKTFIPVQVAIDGDNVAIGARESPTSSVLHRDAPGTWSSASLAGRVMDIDISGDTALLCYDASWAPFGQRIFDRQADGSWTQSAILPKPETAGSNFGLGGAISGNRVLIGNVGVGGHSYIFERDSIGTWSLTATPETNLTGGSGTCVALDGSTAIIAGWPQCIYEQNDSGAWTKVPKLPGVGGGPVAVDGGNAVMKANDERGQTLAFAVRRDANGNWTESQSLGAVATNFSSTQSVAAGGGKLAVVRSDKQISVYAYDSSPRLFYSGFDAGTTLADLGLTSHSDSSGSVQVDSSGVLRLVQGTTGLPGLTNTTGVGKTLDCDEHVTFTFECGSREDQGSLQLTLGGVVLDTIPLSSRGSSYQRTFALADLGLRPGQLDWKLDYTSQWGSSATIDNLFITTIPEPATLSLLALGVLGLHRQR